MFCKACGSQIPDNSTVCPVCGRSLASAPADMSNMGKYSMWAIAGVVLALISLFVANLFGIVAVASIVCSAIGLYQTKQGFKGKAVAIIGLVLGIIAFVLTLLVLFGIFALLA